MLHTASSQLNKQNAQAQPNRTPVSLQFCGLHQIQGLQKYDHQLRHASFGLERCRAFFPEQPVPTCNGPCRRLLFVPFQQGQVDPSSRPQSQPLHSIEPPPIPMSPAEVPKPRNPT
ncbi:hypothetical protein SLA2020_423750 [Shorea laevis]